MNDVFQLNLKARDFASDDVPQDVRIQSKILMHDHVAQSGYFAPLDAVVLLFKVFRQVLGGFTQDLEIMEDGIVRFKVRKERVSGVPG